MEQVYELPPLPYDPDALEPHLSGRLLSLHHDKHHLAYVDGANKAIADLERAREEQDFAYIGQIQKNLAFNLSGHLLHSRFWEVMSPHGGGAPSGELASTIDAQFGGFERLRAQLDAVATSVQGSGWAALAFEPIAGRLIVEQIYDHQTNVAQASTPLLVIDMWEHAYYLDYLNDRAAWLQAFWKIVAWDAVSQRFESMRLVHAGA